MINVIDIKTIVVGSLLPVLRCSLCGRTLGAVLTTVVAVVVLPVSEGADDLVAALYFKLHVHDSVLQLHNLVRVPHQRLVSALDDVAEHAA